MGGLSKVWHPAIACALLAATLCLIGDWIRLSADLRRPPAGRTNTALVSDAVDRTDPAPEPKHDLALPRPLGRPPAAQARAAASSASRLMGPGDLARRAPPVMILRRSERSRCARSLRPWSTAPSSQERGRAPSLGRDLDREIHRAGRPGARELFVVFAHGTKQRASVDTPRGLQ